MNPWSKCKLGSLKKVKNEYLFQIVRRKSCDCILIIYMKKYEIAYYNYAEAKCTHQVQKWFILTLQVTLCVWSKQPCTIKTIIYNDISKFKGWLNSIRNCSVWLLLCTELTLFCTESPENCIYLNQSELSNFLMHLIKEWKFFWATLGSFNIHVAHVYFVRTWK